MYSQLSSSKSSPTPGSLVPVPGTTGSARNTPDRRTSRETPMSQGSTMRRRLTVILIFVSSSEFREKQGSDQPARPDFLQSSVSGVATIDPNPRRSGGEDGVGLVGEIADCASQLDTAPQSANGSAITRSGIVGSIACGGKVAWQNARENSLRLAIRQTCEPSGDRHRVV